MLMSTLYIVAGSLVIAVPVGVAAAVYLAEIASDRTREIMKPAIEMIAAVPSSFWACLALSSSLLWSPGCSLSIPG